MFWKDFRPWRRHPSPHPRQGDGLPLQHGRGQRAGPPHEQHLQQHYQQWKPHWADARVRPRKYNIVLLWLFGMWGKRHRPSAFTVQTFHPGFVYVYMNKSDNRNWLRFLWMVQIPHEGVFHVTNTDTSCWKPRLRGLGEASLWWPLWCFITAAGTASRRVFRFMTAGYHRGPTLQRRLPQTPFLM